MTERQRRFVSEYLKDGNGAQAAIRAGFSKNGANVTASQLLARPSIALAVAEARAPIIAEAGITLEGHLAKLAEIRDKAIAAEQFGPANAAEANRGKVAGLYVERSLVETRQLPALTIE